MEQFTEEKQLTENEEALPTIAELHKLCNTAKKTGSKIFMGQYWVDTPEDKKVKVYIVSKDAHEEEFYYMNKVKILGLGVGIKSFHQSFHQKIAPDVGYNHDSTGLNWLFVTDNITT